MNPYDPATGQFTKKLGDQTEAALVAGYAEGTTTYKLARQFGVSVQTVCNIMHRRGVPMRSVSARHRFYSLDETAFDEINEASAYWIGFLTADGNVRYNRDGCCVISLGLAEKDAAHVELFREFLGTSKPIRRFVAKGFGMAKLEVYSAALGRRLAEFGVTPRKSLTAKVVGLEDNRHFWRGVVDGDGTVGIVRQHGEAPILSLVGSKDMMLQFADYVRSVWPACGVNPCQRGAIYTVGLRSAAAAAMLNHLYGDCTVALPRKLQRSREALAIYKPSFHLKRPRRKQGES
jgi:hypothetical protein